MMFVTRASEVASFADAARHFNPMLVTFTGGEPLMRRDLETIVAAVHDAVRPFIEIETIEKVIKEAAENGAAIARPSRARTSVCASVTYIAL